MSADPKQIAAVTRGEALRFLENDCREWMRFPPLSNGDLDDVADSLTSFLKRRILQGESE